MKTVQQVPFRLSTEQHRQLKIRAAQEGTTIQAILLGLVEAYLDSGDRGKTGT